MNEPVSVTWLGHAAFRMEYRGWSLVTDPYADGMVPGLPPLRQSAGAVYCSHEHDDHNRRDYVRLTRQAPPPDFSVSEAVCPHDSQDGALRGMNTVRLFSFGALRVAHMGDLGCIPDQEILSLVQGCHLMLLPIGGFYTIGEAEAFAVAELARPRALVPMHYRSEAFGFPVLDTVDAFAARFPRVLRCPGPSFLLTENGPEGLVIPSL